MPPDNERGRPAQAASAAPTPIKTTPTVSPSRDDAPYVTPPSAPCGHDDARRCEVDGCPFCRGDLEETNDIDSCETCDQLRREAFLAKVRLNPAWECELADHLHCTGCGGCGNGGGVCRNCYLCVACAAEDPWGDCAVQRWDPTLGEEVYSRHEHEIRHPETDRWTRYDTRTGRWGW